MSDLVRTERNAKIATRCEQLLPAEIDEATRKGYEVQRTAFGRVLPLLELGNGQRRSVKSVQKSSRLLTLLGIDERLEELIIHVHNEVMDVSHHC